MNYSQVRIMVEKPNNELSLNYGYQCKYRCRNCYIKSGCCKSGYILDMYLIVPVEGTLAILTALLVILFRYF